MSEKAQTGSEEVRNRWKRGKLGCREMAGEPRGLAEAHAVGAGAQFKCSGQIRYKEEKTHTLIFFPSVFHLDTS